MKKFLVIIGLAVAMVSTYAASTVVTITATNAAVLTVPAVLESITAVQATNGIIRLYDANAKALVVTNAAYRVTKSYVTNLVETYVSDVTGITNNYTNTVIWYYTATNAAATNAVSPFGVLSATTTAPLTETFNQSLGYGLVISNAGSGDIIVRYRTP